MSRWQRMIALQPVLIMITIGLINIGLDQYQSANAANFPIAHPVITATEAKVTAEDFFNRGDLKYEEEDFQGATMDYGKAIMLKPDYAEAYNNRGNARSELGDNEGAIRDYSQAIKIKPDEASTYCNRGIVKSKSGDKEGAIVDFNQAIKLKPDCVEAYYSRGLTHYQLGHREEALIDYRKGADLLRVQGEIQKD